MLGLRNEFLEHHRAVNIIVFDALHHFRAWPHPGFFSSGVGFLKVNVKAVIVRFVERRQRIFLAALYYRKLIGDVEERFTEIEMV